MRAPVLLAALALAAALPAAADELPSETAAEPEAPAEPVAATGSISGSVRLQSSRPLRFKQRTNTVDVEACGETIEWRSLLVGRSGGVANVLIEARPAAGSAAPPPHAPGPATLRLVRCDMEPRVQVLDPGATVVIENEDGLLHPLRALSVRNEPIDVDLPRYRRRASLAADHFTRAERIKLTCERHPSAAAWLLVVDHGHRVLTGADGAFLLDGLEPGTWTVTAWHEDLGTLRHEVDVVAGGTADAALTFKQ
jgi:hypothetical protein